MQMMPLNLQNLRMAPEYYGQDGMPLNGMRVQPGMLGAGRPMMPGDLQNLRMAPEYYGEDGMPLNGMRIQPGMLGSAMPIRDQARPGMYYR